MIEHILVWITAVAALVAAGYQTYVRFKSKDELRAYATDKWRWPRGIFGDLSVITTWAFLFIAPNWPIFRSFEQPAVCRISGCVILLLAISLRVWAQYCLGLNWSNSIAIRYEHQLVTTGPYHYIRHPMYTGYCLMAIGGVLASTNIILGVIVGCLWWRFLPLLIQRTMLEEQAMQQYLDGYQEYMQITPRFIPLFLTRCWR